MKKSFCSGLTKQPLRPPPGRRCRSAPAAVLAARLAAQSSAKRRPNSSNSATVRLVVARISRSERLANSREIMPLSIPQVQNRRYYQSTLISELSLCAGGQREEKEQHACQACS